MHILVALEASLGFIKLRPVLFHEGQIIGFEPGKSRVQGGEALLLLYIVQLFFGLRGGRRHGQEDRQQGHRTHDSPHGAPRHATVPSSHDTKRRPWAIAKPHSVTRAGRAISCSSLPSAAETTCTKPSLPSRLPPPRYSFAPDFTSAP